MSWWRKTDWWRLGQLAVAVGVSAFIGYRFQPMVANNPDAVNTVVTIFSILAGFLIAVITFIAEPTLQQAKNWEELQHMKETVRRKLFRQKLLFFLYLLTLGLISLLVNGLLFLLVAWISDLLGFGLVVGGFWWGVLGALVLAVLSWLIGLLLRPLGGREEA